MRKLLLCAMLAALLIIPNAFADTIVGTAGYGWQSWIAGNVNENGAPYWDNISADGSQKNIGYYLTNSGSFSASTAGPGAIPFWGSNYNSGTDTVGTGTADPSFYFQKTAPYSTASFKLEIAGNAALNSFGWYNKTGPDAGVLHEIFAGGDTPGVADESFSPAGDYGFYIKVNGEFFTTEGGGPPGFQHFAAFSEGSSYWIGMEDFHGGSDKDYNDIIVKITPVPEPATMLLLGSGLLGLAGFARRRFSKK